MSYINFFKDIYLHALVKDERVEMSKSLEMLSTQMKALKNIVLIFYALLSTYIQGSRY